MMTSSKYHETFLDYVALLNSQKDGDFDAKQEILDRAQKDPNLRPRDYGGLVELVYTGSSW